MDRRRGRVVVAAREELVSGRRFSLEAVAERAGVSRVTVYAQFGDRDALLEAVYDDLAASGGLQHLPEAFMTVDDAAALDSFVRIFCRFYAVHRGVIRRLHAISVVRTVDESTTRDRNPRRRLGLRVLLNRMGVDDDRVLQTLQALTSFAFVDELAGPGRTPDDVASEVSALVAHVVAQVRSESGGVPADDRR
jgi:AcrR family transcriptional regulator